MRATPKHGADRSRHAVAAAIVLLALGTAWRVGYALAQRAADPTFLHPMLDGKYYVDWAGAIASGNAPADAFYLAPLFPYVLSLVTAVFGPGFLLPSLLQQALVLVSAIFVGLYSRRVIGPLAAIFAMALFLFHHPLIFFGSRPLAEPLALVLLTAGLWWSSHETGRGNLVAGVLSGLAALARPNLLLVPAVWIITEAVRGRRRVAATLAVGTFLAVLPVTVRNVVVSGHLVPVSSNAGITAYHGNGPGATGTFTRPRGFSGDVGRQRGEATDLARARSGLDLDAVEADRWWGRMALRTRVEDPVGSLRLLGKRALLLIDNHEHGLDYDPLLDVNPWRATLRWGEHELFLVPFALLLALAVVAVVSKGVHGSGGDRSWTAIAACAATPLIFYVSSRYRLPLSALLAIPAGAGLAALLESTNPRRRIAVVAGVAALAISVAVPFASLRDRETAEALSNRAAAYKIVGDMEAAEQDARRAVALDEGSASAHFNLGVILAVTSRRTEAEASFRQALKHDPGLAEAATNLSRILLERGDAADAVVVLRRALTHRPLQASCWTNLVVALAMNGDMDAALSAAAEAGTWGITLDDSLRRQLDAAAIRRSREPGGGPDQSP